MVKIILANKVLAIFGIAGVIMTLSSASFIIDGISKEFFDNLLTLIIVLAVGVFLIYVSLRYGVKKIDKFLSK